MSSSSNTRNEIQALRAICAITIMVCHIWLNKVSGGVDVFFVISGFFMTALMIKLNQHTWHQSYLFFWRKILTKVIPTAVLIILITTFFAYISYFPLRAEIIRSGALSLAFIENINLIIQDANYLTAQNKSVFQQFWALSIQFQFYLIYPFIFILFKRRQCIVLILLALLSFYYSVYLVNVDPTAAYYHPLSRLWEFYAGGIACLLYRHKCSFQYPFIASLAFLGLLCFAFFYPARFNFPSFSALIPVTLTIIILLNSRSNAFIQRLSRNRFLLFIAQFSFTLYLVHWPIFIFTKYLSFNKTISLLKGLAIIVCSILIAYLIHHYFEKKMSQFLNKLNLFNFYKLMLITLTLGFIVFGTLFFENKYRENTALQALQSGELKHDLLHNVFALRTLGISPRSRNECMSSNADVLVCDWGDLDAKKSIAIIGGSHIEQWIAVFDHFGKTKGYKVLQMTKVDCPLGGAENSTADCKLWSKRAIHMIANNTEIEYIFTNSTRTFDDEQLESIPESYLRSFQSLNHQSSAKLLGIRDNPRFKINPNYCLSNQLKDNAQCNYALNEFIAQKDPALKYPDLIIAVDLTPLYCKDLDQCALFQAQFPIFADANHLSYIFIVSIADAAVEMINQAIDEAL